MTAAGTGRGDAGGFRRAGPLPQAGGGRVLGKADSGRPLSLLLAQGDLSAKVKGTRRLEAKRQRWIVEYPPEQLS